MLLTLPNRDGSHSGLLHIRGSAVDEICINPKLLHADFPISIRDIDNFEAKFNNSYVGAFGTISCDKWVLRKNILLLGDAAHAITPFYGQGTNCGLEDAMMICDIIRDNSGDIERAIGIFQETRPKDTKAISQLSLQNLKNLEVEQGFEDYMTFKSLDHALEQEFSDYFSEYFLVAFSDMSFSEVLQNSTDHHPILLQYAQHKSCKGQENFSKEILERYILS